MKFLLSVMMILSSAQTLFAGEDVVSVTEAWMRPVILQNRPGAAYFIIRNDTGMADRLIRVTSSLADRVEIHVHKHEGGVMKMMRVEDIYIPAHSLVAVEPGEYHLMLFGLKKRLALGDELPLTLFFESAGEIQVAARVMKKAP